MKKISQTKHANFSIQKNQREKFIYGLLEISNIIIRILYQKAYGM